MKRRANLSAESSAPARTGDRKRTYASFPPPDTSNPFQLLLAQGLEKNGWTRVPMTWRPGEILANRKNIEILHFHWPESMWRSRSAVVSLIRSGWFVFRAVLSKLCGYRLVWSAHNVLPHYFVSRRIEIWMRKFILRYFDLIIGHANNCQSDLMKAYGNAGKRFVLAAHGVYTGIYPAIDRTEARRRQGYADEDKVVFLLGSRHEYKGTDLFLKRWSAASTGGLMLHVTGNLSVEAQKIMESLPNKRYLPGFVSDEVLAECLSACDIVALPYRAITTSGTYFLALTFNRPVLAPRSSFFEAHAGDAVALLYDGDESGVDVALDRLKSGWEPIPGAMDVLRQRYDWNESARSIADAYDEILTD